MVSDAMLPSLEGVEVRRRGKTILGPLDLSLSRDGVTIVLGPNGAGKTTLLKVLHGVERVSGGNINWSVPMEQTRQSQAYVFQSPVMLRRSVGQNLAYPLKLLGLTKPEIASLVDDWAGRIGLGDALDRPAVRLSGGEKQKLALGRALIRNPKVLFLDEPCANLDGRSTRDIEALLLNANLNGTRVLMTTHDLGQCRRLANDILFMLNGCVHDGGEAATFLSAPETPEARAFLDGDIVY